MTRVTVTLPVALLEETDELLEGSGLLNRSRFVQAALREYLRALRDRHLVAEAAKLDAAEEEALAEEGMTAVDEVSEGEA